MRHALGEGRTKTTATFPRWHSTSYPESVKPETAAEEGEQQAPPGPASEVS